jgi:hypothetical protein
MKLLKYLAIILFVAFVSTGFAQQPFTAGNIVVYRVGDGSATLTTTMEKVYLDEYTPSGTLVQSILMPVTGKKVSMFGRNDAGYLTLSNDGRYLVVPGWDVDAGTTPGTIVGLNRSLGLVDFNGEVSNVISVGNNPGNTQIVSAITDNGSNYWIGGGTRLDYVPASTSTATSIATVAGASYGLTISQGQLYAATNIRAQPVVKVGNGLPTASGQTLTALPGIPERTNPRQFAFADLDPTIPGMDVLYLASQGSTVGGLQKYSLVNGTWVLNGTVGVLGDYYAGLTIKISANSVTIFATRKGGNTAGINGGELISLTDNSGYNGSLSGTPTVLASVPVADTKAFRGIALVPQPAPFTAGNIVVYRVGDGTGVLSTSMVKVYLDEYTPSGNLVQSILMPVTGKKISMFGRNDAGYLTLSNDGKYLVVPGWDVDAGTTPGTIIGLNRSLGLVDFNGTVSNVTSVGNNPGNTPIVSAITDDGSNYWISGGARLDYVPASTSTATSVATVGGASYGLTVTQGQLYAATTIRAQPVVKVGNGLPTTSGQTLTALPGIPERTNPRQFAFADLDAAVPGMDVLYLASQGSTVGGIQKYSLVNGMWVLNGTVGVLDDYYAGLTIKISANIVTIFATRKGGNTTGINGGELVSLTDNSGYNGMFSGTPTVLASVPVADTKAFRGIANVALGCPVVLSLRVPDISSTEARIIWNSPASGGGNYEYAVTTSLVPPASGTATTDTFAYVTGLTDATTYYVYVRSNCNKFSPSEWVALSFKTGCQPPATPQVNITVSGTGVVTAKWRSVFGAATYEYLITTSDTPPLSGTATGDTAVVLSDLNTVTQYYFYVRSVCGGGAVSAWIKKPFSTSCFAPTPNVVSVSPATWLKWNRISGAVKYEYALTFSPAKPLSGTYINDTVYAVAKVTEGSSYYFHIRAVCANGTVSEWSSQLFNTRGLQVYPNPVRDVLQVQLNGTVNATGEIVVCDVRGKVMIKTRLNNSNTTINTRAWLAGIYFIRYDDGRSNQTIKIFKQ